MDGKVLKVFCEYTESPIGLDVLPRFSWRPEDTARCGKQVAYQITVKRENGEEVWESGKVQSEECLNVTYAGKELESHVLYQYTVQMTDSEGTLFRGTSSFRMGCLHEADWKGYWIKPGAWCGGTVSFTSAKLFREFQILKKVRCALIYVAGLGCYELTVNGEKISDMVLGNAQTAYEKTILYKCYEVTEKLLEGDNCIGVSLGNGWINRMASDHNEFTDWICAIIQMEIEYEDGTRESIYTEPKYWKAADPGGYVANSVYNGSVFDATRENPEWGLPGFEKRHPELVRCVEITESPGGILVSQQLEPERVTEVIAPVSLKKRKNGAIQLDFGVNFSGNPRIRLRQPRGTRLTMKYAEILDSEGNLNPGSYFPKHPADTYVCSGEDGEVFEPRFTYRAFQYMEIYGVVAPVEQEDVDGLVVRNDIPKIASFECGSDIINKMQKAIEITEANNHHNAPTDCPHRERAGFLNDMTGRVDQASYNYDMVKMYAKWTKDIRDTQGERTGTIADTAPYVHGPRNGAPVNSSFLIAPWLMYLHNADQRILEENYEGMKKWQGYLTLMSREGLQLNYHYGDWSAPAKYCVPDEMGIGAISALSPGEVIASALYYYNAMLLSKIARILKKTEDIETYQDMAEQIKKAFNAKWLDQKTANYATGSQACNAIALWTGVVPREYERKVAKNLADDVIKQGYHLTTGNICTKYLIEMLFYYHYENVAYKLLTQTTYPSWGYMFQLGATTYWERWEDMTNSVEVMASRNHPMQGSACSAFHKYLAGIQPTEEQPGFKKILFCPHPVPEIGYMKDCIQSKRGNISSSWEYDEKGNLAYSFCVPFNSEAEIKIPLASTAQVYLNDILIWNGEVADGVLGENIRDVCVENHEYLHIETLSGSYCISARK